MEKKSTTGSDVKKSAGYKVPRERIQMHRIYFIIFFVRCFSSIKIYQRINIRVVMKALEIWTNGDPYERAEKGGPDLGRFNTYRRDHLLKKFPHDNAQLLR